MRCHVYPSEGASGRRLFVVFRARNLDPQTVRKKGCHESREGHPEQDGDERVVGHCNPKSSSCCRPWLFQNRGQHSALT